MFCTSHVRRSRRSRRTSFSFSHSHSFLLRSHSHFLLHSVFFSRTLYFTVSESFYTFHICMVCTFSRCLSPLSFPAYTCPCTSVVFLHFPTCTCAHGISLSYICCWDSYAFTLTSAWRRGGVLLPAAVTPPWSAHST